MVKTVNMGWKYTAEISRQEAISLINQRMNNMEDLTNEELANMVGDLYGDDTNLAYYGANFWVTDKE